MDAKRREEIEEEISKMPKSQRKVSKKDQANSFLIMIGIYGGLIGGISLIRYLWD